MRFQTKLLIIFAVLFAISMGLMVAFTLQSERHIVERIEKNLQNIVKSVHFSTQKLSAEGSSDRDALEAFMLEATQNKAVKEIIIVNADQQVVASTNVEKLGKHQKLTGHEMIIREQFGVADSQGQHDQYIVNIPIQREGKVIGLVQTSIVVDDFSQMLRDLSRKNMLVAGIAFFTIFLIFSVLLFGVSRPLQQLSDAADKIAEGEFSIDIPSKGRDEVGKLSRSFKLMAQKLLEHKDLEEKVRGMERRAILSETAATLAHEIRNPLNLINLTADHLGHQFAPANPKQASAYQDIIKNLKAEVKQLNQMVGEFLTIGKPIKIKRTKFRIQELFEQVESLVKQHAVSKNLILKSAIPPELVLHADLQQLQLVLLNLMLNAIQISRDGESIIVSAREDAGKILISVADSGPGIDPSHLDRIFEPYFTKRPDGTGLGLALARRIVEEHHGQIRARNVEHGACFEIILPFGEHNGESSGS
jgi:signal transduction histidine kinase